MGACVGALLAQGAGRGAATPFRVAVLEPTSAADAGRRFANRSACCCRVALERADIAWRRGRGIGLARRCRLARRRLMRWPRLCLALILMSACASGMRALLRGPAGALVFDAADVGEPNLGYIVENRVLQAALLDTFEAAGGVIEPAQFVGLRIGADAVTRRDHQWHVGGEARYRRGWGAVFCETGSGPHCGRF